jgi:nucleoside phosphorylase
VILFVASESREFRGLVRKLRGRRRLKWAVQFALGGELNGNQAALVADGPGPDLAGRAADVACENVARENGQIDYVVSTGFCGGLHPELPRGTIVIATAIVDSSGNMLAETRLPVNRSAHWKPAKEKLMSMNCVAVNPDEKRALAATGAGAVEMEAAGVCRRARAWGVPFYGIRVVTDAASDGFSIDFNRMRDSEGRFSRSRIIVEACRNPYKLFPELLEFNQRCDAAAITLGDFIADCQF